jgi:hypothetical protein
VEREPDGENVVDLVVSTPALRGEVRLGEDLRLALELVPLTVGDVGTAGAV